MSRQVLAESKAAKARSSTPALSGFLERERLGRADDGPERTGEHRTPRHDFGRLRVHELRSAAIQPKLKMGTPEDKYERQADRIADEVMRMPHPTRQQNAEFSEHAVGPRLQRKCQECEKEELHRQQMGEEEDEELQMKLPPSAGSVQRRPIEEEKEDEELQAKELPGRIPVVTPETQARINALRGGGQPLPESVRAFYEPRFGVDFSTTRIHTGPVAAETTRSLNARAFTLGRDIFFNQREFQPGTDGGKRLLAHELTHVVQQAKSSSYLRLPRHHSAAHPSSGVVAASINEVTHPPPLQYPILLTKPSPERFQERLGRTKEQETVVSHLFKHPTFIMLWKWLGNCKCEKGDHGPIKLRVHRTFRDGVQTFGGFDQEHGILTINPMIRAVRENPQELVDTVVHEVVHAISWAWRNKLCPGQQSPLQELDIISPLEGDKTLLEKIQSRKSPCKRTRFPVAPPPKSLTLANIKGGLEELEQIEISGPSASDPCSHFQDIREEPQAKIVEIIDDIQQQTGIGGPTRTLVNQILREDVRRAKQKAGGFSEIREQAPRLRSFMQCRDEECVKPRRKRRIERCFNDVLIHDERNDVTQGARQQDTARLVGHPRQSQLIQRKVGRAEEAAEKTEAQGQQQGTETKGRNETGENREVTPHFRNQLDFLLRERTSTSTTLRRVEIPTPAGFSEDSEELESTLLEGEGKLKLRGCEGSEEQLDEVLRQARRFADAGVTCLESGDSLIFQEWFGQHTPARQRRILRRMKRLRNWLFERSIRLICVPREKVRESQVPGLPVCRTFVGKDGQKRHTVAHAKGVIFTPVWLCPPFFDEPRDEQATTLVHEAAHAAFSALDLGEAGEVSQTLASGLNADNFAEFAQSAFSTRCSLAEASELTAEDADQLRAGQVASLIQRQVGSEEKKEGEGTLQASSPGSTNKSVGSCQDGMLQRSPADTEHLPSGTAQSSLHRWLSKLPRGGAVRATRRNRRRAESVIMLHNARVVGFDLYRDHPASVLQSIRALAAHARVRPPDLRDLPAPLLDAAIAEFRQRSQRAKGLREGFEAVLAARREVDEAGISLQPPELIERIELDRLERRNLNPIRRASVHQQGITLDVTFHVEFPGRSLDETAALFPKVRTALENGLERFWNKKIGSNPDIYERLDPDVSLPFEGRDFEIRPQVSLTFETAPRDKRFWLISVRPSPDAAPECRGTPLVEETEGDIADISRTAVTNPFVCAGVVSLPPSLMQNELVIAHELLHLFGLVDRYISLFSRDAQGRPLSLQLTKRRGGDQPDLLGGELEIDLQTGEVNFDVPVDEITVLDEDLLFLLQGLGIGSAEVRRGEKAIPTIERIVGRSVTLEQLLTVRRPKAERSFELGTRGDFIDILKRRATDLP